jgi:hypothetical protein
MNKLRRPTILSATRQFTMEHRSTLVIPSVGWTGGPPKQMKIGDFRRSEAEGPAVPSTCNQCSRAPLSATSQFALETPLTLLSSRLPRFAVGPERSANAR